MLILIAAGLTAMVMYLFGWLFDDISRGLDRAYDKAQRYIDDGRKYHD